MQQGVRSISVVLLSHAGCSGDQADLVVWSETQTSVWVVGLELGQALSRLGVRVRMFGRNGSLGGIAVAAMLAMPFYHPIIEEGVRTALKDLHNNLKETAAEGDPCLECGPGS